jgi:hypothetical protein
MAFDFPILVDFAKEIEKLSSGVASGTLTEKRTSNNEL